MHSIVLWKSWETYCKNIVFDQIRKKEKDVKNNDFPLLNCKHSVNTSLEYCLNTFEVFIKILYQDSTIIFTFFSHVETTEVNCW